ncbi:hypothetical protein SAMN05421734_102207 [Pelagirhabdus alkalitolerans]|uniref:YlxR domain-containing protein n=1 Tax=Pelagirhabdus alkalitolerans TaxID=1612202 RepID=A0A1G6H4G5_9BACI|nr:YlxR family protein [Pelagirhabdus alkalitolerans]SDB89034.1 hypothetical protein SAMN05421734_102207 [Pelagirhabdus alkalitolerans]
MPKKNKKVPLRKCLITQEMKPKKSLIRIVRTKENEVFVDPTSKKNGRGAYVSKDSNVIEEARKKQVIEQEFKVKDIDHIYKDLLDLVNGEIDE